MYTHYSKESKSQKYKKFCSANPGVCPEPATVVHKKAGGVPNISAMISHGENAHGSHLNAPAHKPVAAPKQVVVFHKPKSKAGGAPKIAALIVKGENAQGSHLNVPVHAPAAVHVMTQNEELRAEI